MARYQHEPADVREALRRAGALGADLDLTLLDTRAATAHALRAVNRRCGETIDVDAFVARLGPPIRQELAHWVAPERIPQAVEVFRDCFLSEGIHLLRPLPGAGDLADAVTAASRRLVVITSRIPQVARRCLTVCGLSTAAVVGGVTGPEKAAPMTAHRIAVYVGDHVLDMQAAKIAGIPGIAVTTGSHRAGELRQAGAAWILDDLTDLAHLVRRTHTGIDDTEP
ncbi:HAD family hydrolase [Streptacidiphilus rugosus]|uniref:HAD family hydrolase n=1 Tax=Streptacidiphilus rugosus TaxID=405783 RepID=UPI00068ED0AD|nr:HAD hydrolase-like protein [Streptacidiphilus rugosus]